MEDKYYFLKELLQHSSTICHYTGVFTSLTGMLMNYFHAGLFWVKNVFACRPPIFLAFSSKSLIAFVERDKRKFARSFCSVFFCLSAIAKSLVSLLILFSTINSDTSELDNLLGFFISLFCSFCCSLFCSLFAALFSLLTFYDRHLYSVLFERYLFPLNFNDLDYNIET